MQTVATLDRDCLAHAKFTSAMDAIARSDTSGFLRSMRLDHHPADIGTWMSDIIQETALHFRLSEAALTGRDRAAAITRPRHVAIYLCRRLAGKSVGQIAARFDRDHSSICSAIKKIEQLRAADLDLDYSLRTIAGVLGRTI